MPNIVLLLPVSIVLSDSSGIAHSELLLGVLRLLGGRFEVKMPPPMPDDTMALIYNQLFGLQLPVSTIAAKHGVSERSVRK
jgi:hypothetical protein